MRSWFQGQQFPLAVGVAFWSGGELAVPSVDSHLTASGALCTGLQQAMERLAGRTVCGLRLAAAGMGGAAGDGGRAEIDVLLTSAACGAGARAAVGGGGGIGSGEDSSGDSDEEDDSSDSGSGETASSERSDWNGDDSHSDGDDSHSDSEGGGGGGGYAAHSRTLWRELPDDAGRPVLVGGVSAGPAPPAPRAMEALSACWPLRAGSPRRVARGFPSCRAAGLAVRDCCCAQQANGAATAASGPLL
jgi:hypothetical protein